MSHVTQSLPYDPETALRRYLTLGLVAVAVLVIGIGGLAATISLAGAVIAPGQVVVSSDVKTVQHPTGGVVSAIRVKDGTRVRAGDILLELDPTQTGANLNVASNAVDAAAAKQARLRAERDNEDHVSFPPELLARRNVPSAAEAMNNEVRAFQLRGNARRGQKAQLDQRKLQLQQQISGLEEEAAAKARQIQLIEQELVSVRELYRKDLVPLPRLNALEREAAQLRGDVAQLRSAAAEARGKISETTLQSIQVDEGIRSDAGSQLSEVENQLQEFKQKQLTAEQDYRRVLVRAPQSGVVDRLMTHTIGGVISPGEPILVIVPDNERLRVEARIRPSEVDQVRRGQTAQVRFAAFNQRTTPELAGVVAAVSPQAEMDEKTGASFYRVSVEIPEHELKRLGGLKLLPGMPAECFIQSSRRTMLSYVTKPLTDQVRRAFREG